jgi:HSP20 family protein
MSIVKTNRFALPSVFSDFFDSDGLFSNRLGTEDNSLSLPPVNVSESPRFYKLELAVPGYKKEEIKVQLEQDMLSISAETGEEKKEEKEAFLRREFSYGTFHRAFRLPKGIVHEGISAKYENGIMYIEIPKTGPSPGAGKLNIQIS